MEEKSKTFDVYEHVPELKDEKYQRLIYHNGMSRPMSIAVETVNSCNYSCIFCAARKKRVRAAETMPMELFEKVIERYKEIGGGFISLTPVVGDVFMDRFLVDRFELLKGAGHIAGVAYHTNAALSDRLSDNDLKFIVDNSWRITFSFYGMDREEHAEITGVDDYDRALASVKRVAGLAGVGKTILSLRALKKRGRQEIDDWVASNNIPINEYGAQCDFFNWDGAVDERGEAAGKVPLFCREGNNATVCVLPAQAIRIFSNGNVSLCPCMDYKGVAELRLGNINDNSLAQMCNSEKVIEYWSSDMNGGLPYICRKCTWHHPVSTLPQIDAAVKIMNDALDNGKRCIGKVTI